MKQQQKISPARKEQIRQLQIAGITKAIQNGVSFGRPRMKMPVDFSRVYMLWENNEITTAIAAEMLHIKVYQFYSLAPRYSPEYKQHMAKKCGRHALVEPQGFARIYSLWRKGEITAKDAAEQLGIKLTSFRSMVAKYPDLQGCTVRGKM
jgi:hypothetical protein